MNVNDATPSRTDGPAKIAMHAVPGFGKTTIACHLPNPIVVGPERGIPRNLGFEVKELHPATWLDLFSIVQSLTRDRHSFGTLVVDTVDWIEPLIHRHCLERDSERKTEMNSKGHKLESIEDYGYGKGYLVAEEEFRKFISVLDTMQAKRGIHVALLMHSITRTFKNPSGPDYDRWEPKAQQRIAKVVSEWAENMVFGFFQIDAAKISADKERNEKTARAKGIGAGVRIIGTQNCAMYDAKNRVGLPPEFELGEDLTTLVEALLGEHVQVKERRAPQRNQRDTYTDAPGTQIYDAGISVDPAKTEARTWTDPKPPARQPAIDLEAVERSPNNNGFRAPEVVAELDREDAARAEASRRARAPEATNGTAHKPVNGKLDNDLQAARKRAAQLGDKYMSTVDSWIKKAGGDPVKLAKIIDKVNADASAQR